MIIELTGVSKQFSKSRFKLDNISFAINEGEIVGLIGSNGTGKSTILKLLNGLIPYDKGKICYQGRDLKDLSNQQLREMRKDIAYIFQHHNLLLGETVYYHLSLVYKLNRSPVDQQAIDQILEFLGLMRLKHIKCRHLSGGQQQKVAIAMAILQQPRLILCDEISAALDIHSEKEIFDLLAKLSKDYGIAILMIAHQLSILKDYCDRVMIIDDGTIAEVVVPVKSGSNQPSKDYVSQVKEFLLDD